MEMELNCGDSPTVRLKLLQRTGLKATFFDNTSVSFVDFVFEKIVSVPF